MILWEIYAKYISVLSHYKTETWIRNLFVLTFLSSDLKDRLLKKSLTNRLLI